jgi:hypothetical protein
MRNKNIVFLWLTVKILYKNVIIFIIINVILKDINKLLKIFVKIKINIDIYLKDINLFNFL